MKYLIRIFAIELSFSSQYEKERRLAFLQSCFVFVLFADIWKPAPSNVTVIATDDIPAGSISGLHPSYTYQIRALAINAIGIGSPSTVITVSTDEEGEYKEKLYLNRQKF